MEGAARAGASQVRQQEGMPSPVWIVDTDFAYAAGLIDADGSICYTKVRRNDSKTGIRFVVLLELENKAPSLPQWLKTTFGGSFFSYTKNSQWKEQELWRWCLTCRRAMALIKRIQPFLTLKKKWADILIANEELIFAGTKLDQARIKALDVVHAQMRRGHK